MQSHEIVQLAAWLAATDIDILELQGPGQQLRLERPVAGGVAGTTTALQVAHAAPTALSAAAPVASAPAALVPAASTPAASAPAAPSARHAVRAPSVGVLRDRPAGRAAPLAARGVRVQAGDLIAVLQIGPLLLPVRAPVAGHLALWRVPFGDTVDQGMHLADIQP